MKKIFLFLAFALSFLINDATAQVVNRTLPTSYSTRVPTNTPSLTQSHLWFHTGASTLYGYDRATSEWAPYSKQAAYGEISISSDTATLSFTGTTPAAIDELTTGLLRDFSFTNDSTLTYDGAAAGVFHISYSTSFSFAEAGIMNGYIKVGSTAVTRSKFRQSVTTATSERVNAAGSCIVNLSPGDIIRFVFAPSSHTGTDVLTVYEMNLNARQIN